MSDHFWFYVETRTSGGWDLPAEHVDLQADHHRQVRHFAWLRGSSRLRALFFGGGTRFPFRRGEPPAWESSALFRWLRPGGVEREMPEIGWIPFAELMVDLWDETRLVVRGSVPAASAALFGDGGQPFPEAALRAAGWDEHEIGRLSEGAPAGAAIDRTFGAARHEIDASRPEQPLDVTWSASISEYLGRERADAFRSLRRFGDDADLRVVSTLC